jgi:hypothetical protein
MNETMRDILRFSSDAEAGLFERHCNPVIRGRNQPPR